MVKKVKYLGNIRTYVDTSVYGGVFDEDFKEDSLRFFELVKKKYFKLVISSVVSLEVSGANRKVQDFFSNLLIDAELVEVNEESIRLREQYINAGIVNKQSLVDALHVATASIARVPLVISWNFKHIVNFKKIPLYNAVNIANGYPNIGIYSPKEVIEIDE